MGSFIDRQQRRRHSNIHVLAAPGLLPAIESRDNRDHCLQSGVHVRMRETVGARLCQRVTVVTNTVMSEAGFGLYGWSIRHPAAPGAALSIPGDRSVDQFRVSLG